MSKEGPKLTKEQEARILRIMMAHMIGETILEANERGVDVVVKARTAIKDGEQNGN